MSTLAPTALSHTTHPSAHHEGIVESELGHMVDGLTAFVTLVQFLICVVGILLYILTCWMMIKYRKSTFTNPFYTLAIALSAPDTLHLCMELICSVPVAFIGFENVPMEFVAVCGYFTDVAYWTLAPMMVVIGVNRYVAVCHFQSYKRLFSSFRLKLMILGCVAMGFFIPSLMYGCTCYFMFKGYAWKFYCTGGCAETALFFNMTISSSLTILVALIYVVIFVQYKLIQRRIGRANKGRTANGNAAAGGDSNRQSKKEAALMFQFGIISLVLIGYIGSFWVVSLAWPNVYGDMFINLLISVNSSVSPALYLSFGSEFKARLPWMRKKIANGQLSVPGAGASNSASRTVTKQIIEVKPAVE